MAHHPVRTWWKDEAGYHCYYCGVLLTKPPGGKLFKGIKFLSTMHTWDHLIPRAKGGTLRDKVRACHECNTTKGILSVEEFRIVLAMHRNFDGAAMIATPMKFYGESL